MKENFLPEGMTENEFIKYLCMEEDWKYGENYRD